MRARTVPDEAGQAEESGAVLQILTASMEAQFFGGVVAGIAGCGPGLAGDPVQVAGSQKPRPIAAL